MQTKTCYYMEVLIEQNKKCGCGKEMAWSKVRSSSGQVYSYDSQYEAERMALMCYGDEIRFKGWGKTVRITNN